MDAEQIKTLLQLYSEEMDRAIGVEISDIVKIDNLMDEYEELAEEWSFNYEVNGVFLVADVDKTEYIIYFVPFNDNIFKESILRELETFLNNRLQNRVTHKGKYKSLEIKDLSDSSGLFKL